VTNRESFDAVAWWFAERNKDTSALAVRMMVGNKTDKVRGGSIRSDQSISWVQVVDVYTSLFIFFIFFFSTQGHMRQVSTEEGAALAARMGCLFVESSAKTAVGVRDTFRDVVERIVDTSAF